MVAQMCANWNLPVFTWYNPGIEFDSTLTYPTLVRMVPSLNAMSKYLLKTECVLGLTSLLVWGAYFVLNLSLLVIERPINTFFHIKQSF